jgi:hypothetical protein
LGIAVFVVALLRARGYGLWVGFQGCVLFGWITSEVILLRTVVWVHYVYWGMALILIATGWALTREVRPAHSPSDVSMNAHPERAGCRVKPRHSNLDSFSSRNGQAG